MRIRVIGAAGGEVTGSAYLVRTNRANVLVDCGMFQGGRAAEAKNRPPPPPHTKTAPPGGGPGKFGPTGGHPPPSTPGV